MFDVTTRSTIHLVLQTARYRSVQRNKELFLKHRARVEQKNICSRRGWLKVTTYKLHQN